MPQCEFCERNDLCVSNYNAEKKFECPICRYKRLGIEESMSKEKIMEKLVIAQRELHCISQSLKTTSAMLDVEQRQLIKAQNCLKRWLNYGEHTHCESVILMDETKKIIKY
jgi:hypothetical protein